MPVVQDAIIEALTEVFAKELVDDDHPYGHMSEISAAVKEACPSIAEMVSMGRMDWEDRFFDLGYDYHDLDDLEYRLKRIIDQERAARVLSGTLKEVYDLDDEEELRLTIRQFFGPYAETAATRLVFNDRFPEHAIALAVVVRQFANLTDFLLFAETERRGAAAPSTGEPYRTESKRKAAQALADLGLEEEAAEWPQ